MFDHIYLLLNDHKRVLSIKDGHEGSQKYDVHDNGLKR